MRRLLTLCALAGLSAPAASAQTAVYAEGIGATGSYAVGVEQGVLASASGERRLAVRVGASYAREASAFNTLTARYAFIVPVGAVASFGLGAPAGLPLAAEIGAGAIVARRRGGYVDRNNAKLGAALYGDVALRAAVARRIALRAGLLVGGNDAAVLFESNRVRPVVGVGFRL